LILVLLLLKWYIINFHFTEWKNNLYDVDAYLDVQPLDVIHFYVVFSIPSIYVCFKDVQDDIGNASPYQNTTLIILECIHSITVGWFWPVLTILLRLKSLPFIVSEKSPNFSHTIGNCYSKVCTDRKSVNLQFHLHVAQTVLLM